MDGGWGIAEAESQAWVNRLTMVVLTLTLLYLIVGIPEFSRNEAADLATDAVDPIHRFAWVALFAAAIPVAYKRWRPALALLLASWPLLLLYALFGLSVAWALDPGVALRRFVLALMQVLQLAVLVCGLRRAAILHAMIASACVLGAGADVLTYIVAPGFAMAPDGFVGLQLQKNQTGLMLMYGCLSAGTLFFLVHGRWVRWCIAGSVVMMAGMLVATRSTTSQSVVIMTPFAMSLILAVSRLRTPAIWAVTMAVLLAIVATAFGYLAWCSITDTDPWLPMRGVTFTMRTDIWSFVMEEVDKRPWLGSGYASFWSINPELQPSLKTDQWFGTYAIINEAHNGYLDLLVTNGIVGLAGGLLVTFRTMGMAGLALVRAQPARLAWQTGQLARPTAVFHMALLIGLLVHNFTETSLFASNSLLLSGFLLATLDLQKWKIATRRPPEPRFPNPARFRRRRPVAAAADTAAAAP